MSHSNQDAEEREFNRVRAIPFERINGCPTWQKYLKLKQQASKIAVGSEVDYDWTLCAAGHKYGLLADIIGGEEYEDITGIAQNDYTKFQHLKLSIDQPHGQLLCYIQYVESTERSTHQ